MLFSIIIPLYNKSGTIVETLESCIAQTFLDFEVIVVDDGSKDDSLQKAKSVRDSRIRILSQSNAGVSVARNKGVDEAKGEWILCLDADDCLLPSALSHFAEAIMLKPKYGAFVADTWLSRNNRPLTPKHITTVSSYGYVQYAFKNFLPNAGCAIIRRDIFFEERYDSRMSFYEDQDLYLRVMGKTSWGYLPVATYLHRLETTELSSGHHPINREAAYYFGELNFTSLFQQLAYCRILNFCQWSRYVEGDVDGLRYYENLSKQKFSFLCRLINRLYKLWTKYKNKVLPR